MCGGKYVSTVCLKAGRWEALTNEPLEGVVGNCWPSCESKAAPVRLNHERNAAAGWLSAGFRVTAQV